MGMETETRAGAAARLLAIIESGEACPITTLGGLFGELEPISADDMIGMWRGGLFDGGKAPDPIRWYGKRFVSRAHVDPLMCRAKDGTIYSYDKLGFAQLREMTYNGVTSAALIYDKHPIMDYFRKVTDDIVVGRGETKGQDDDLFFHLTRE
jgi:hypothetical protein